jgi:hypothetical protein
LKKNGFDCVAKRRQPSPVDAGIFNDLFGRIVEPEVQKFVNHRAMLCRTAACRRTPSPS